jgi:ribose 1,5-bisphosphokinase PhnN
MTIDLTWARSMRAVRALPTYPIDTVVVVGPSGAGKSTLIDAVRDAHLPGVDVPLRYVTRPPRATDLRETIPLSPEAFEHHVRDGSIAMHWIRSLDEGRTVRYGFVARRPGTLAVLSANSAIVSPAGQLQPATALARALVLGVVAPRAVREARLVRRSGDLRPTELAYRLAHDDDPDVHVTVENHGALEPIALTEIVELVARLALEAR